MVYDDKWWLTILESFFRKSNLLWGTSGFQDTEPENHPQIYMGRAWSKGPHNYLDCQWHNEPTSCEGVNSWLLCWPTTSSGGELGWMLLVVNHGQWLIRSGWQTITSNWLLIEPSKKHVLVKLVDQSYILSVDRTNVSFVLYLGMNILTMA